ncbi:phosphatase PAP2 family protein [Synechococcus sp. NB0720_010]|uniref:phosphatase PAP2 family protein n=1 Tax=Synechococcus sp. NB0720_010 TaxID=2907159 RepID=UPI001FF8C0F1|nr:phosphatase PAP2 family protein [Synechococcus sp. NB0720_010]UPH90239.1 phosphatase PAP2 family protein [Synechococcus sp. NB0720_010]
MPPLLREWLNALGRRRLLLTLAIAVVLLVVSPTLKANASDSFDRVLLDGLHQRIPAWLGQLLLVVYQASGIHVTAVLVLAVLGFLAFKRFWPDLVCVVAGTGGILVIVDRLLKPWFDRPRPDASLLELSGRSFPSGHAAGSVVFYFMSCTLLAAHYPRLRRPLFLLSSLWVALVWLSTLYCRAHWPTDILAGAAVGYVWLSFCLAGFTVWERHHPTSSSIHG